MLACANLGMFNKAFRIAYTNEWRDIVLQMHEDNRYFGQKRLLKPPPASLLAFLASDNSGCQQATAAYFEAAAQGQRPGSEGGSAATDDQHDGGEATEDEHDGDVVQHDGSEATDDQHDRGEVTEDEHNGGEAEKAARQTSIEEDSANETPAEKLIGATVTESCLDECAEAGAQKAGAEEE